jgi:hypothetical protein
MNNASYVTVSPQSGALRGTSVKVNPNPLPTPFGDCHHKGVSGESDQCTGVSPVPPRSTLFAAGIERDGRAAGPLIVWAQVRRRRIVRSRKSRFVPYTFTLPFEGRGACPPPLHFVCLQRLNAKVGVGLVLACRRLLRSALFVLSIYCISTGRSAVVLLTARALGPGSVRPGFRRVAASIITPKHIGGI